MGSSPYDTGAVTGILGREPSQREKAKDPEPVVGRDDHRPALVHADEVVNVAVRARRTAGVVAPVDPKKNRQQPPKQSANRPRILSSAIQTTLFGTVVTVLVEASEEKRVKMMSKSLHRSPAASSLPMAARVVKTLRPRQSSDCERLPWAFHCTQGLGCDVASSVPFQPVKMAEGVARKL